MYIHWLVILGVGRKSLSGQVVHAPRTYSSFHSIKLPGVFLLTLGWDTSSAHIYPGSSITCKFAITHIYTWEDRGNVRVKCENNPLMHYQSLYHCCFTLQIYQRFVSVWWATWLICKLVFTITATNMVWIQFLPRVLSGLNLFLAYLPSSKESSLFTPLFVRHQKQHC